MTNNPSYELDYSRGIAAADIRPHPQDLFDAVDSQSPRAPLLVVMLIGLFAFTVLTMGTTILFRVPYYLGILSALLAILVYFQYSLPIPLPVILYVSWIAWSLVTALGAEMGEAIYLAMQTVAQIMVMFAIFATICQDGRSVWIVGAAFVLGSLVNIASASLFGLNVSGGRSAGLMSNPNGAALIYGIAICILLPAIAAVRLLAVRVVAVVLLIVLLYGAVSTASRGGALGCVAPMLYFAWFYRGAIVRKPLLLVFLLALVAAGAVFLPARLAKTEMGRRWNAAVGALSGESSQGESSVEHRVSLKYKALRVAVEHPIAGVGIGNFTPYVFRTQGETQSTHDNYLDVLVGTGLPGFILYYSIFVWLWVIAGRLRRSPFVSDGEIALLAMTRMFIVFRATWDLFDNTGWSFKPNWIVIAILAGYLTGLRIRVQQRSAISTSYGLT